MTDHPKLPTTTPEFGQDLPAAHPSAELLQLLSLRRSTTVATIGGPGPDAQTVERLLTLAARVPDHRRIVPFRFIVFAEDDRTAFGDVLANAAEANDEAPTPEQARGWFERAPVVIALIASPNLIHKTPEWEQILTVGAVGQNLLLAASGAGFAAQWLTEWVAYDPKVMAAMGLEPHERIAGLFYLGTAVEPPKERARPDVPALIRRWTKTS